MNFEGFCQGKLVDLARFKSDCYFEIESGGIIFISTFSMRKKVLLAAKIIDEKCRFNLIKEHFLVEE